MLVKFHFLSNSSVYIIIMYHYNNNYVYAQNIYMFEFDIYTFGTCRVSYPSHENIKFIKNIREYHSNHYKINSNINIYTQPVNYTTNLNDILDSIYYMKGKLYNNLNPMNHKMLQSIFLRGHKQPPTNFINPNTHPSLDSTKKINFSKIIIEVFSIKKNIINTREYGEEFYLKNLPWKYVQAMNIMV